MRSKFILLIITTLSIQTGFACSAIVVKNKSQVFLGKNFDWTYGSGYLLQNQRGIHKKAFPTRIQGTPASWTSKYGSITFNQNGKEMPYGGMNEKGLVIEQLWQEYTYYPQSGEKPYVNELEWIQYQLDNYATVEEVLEHLHELKICAVKGKIHYIVADITGRSVVFDFMLDTVFTEEKDIFSCQAITNYPAHSSRANYEKQGEQLKGQNGDHLHRYNVLQRKIDLNEFDKAALNKADVFDALNQVRIEKSAFKTYWSIVYDISAAVVSFHTSGFGEVKEISFASLDFDKPCRGLDMNRKSGGDIKEDLLELTPEKNKKLIQYSFKKLGLNKINSMELSKHQFDFDASKDNTYTKNYSTLELNFESKGEGLDYFIFAVMNSDKMVKKQQSIYGGSGYITLIRDTYSWAYYAIPKGKYMAISVQDKNQNRTLDFDQDGKPIESYAVSNGLELVDKQFPSLKNAGVVCDGDYHTIQMKFR